MSFTITANEGFIISALYVDGKPVAGAAGKTAFLYTESNVSADHKIRVEYLSAEENYDMKYIRPQESGSHCDCKYLAVKDLFKVTAEKPFSCSVNPYTTEQLRETRHAFELEENDFVNVCIDVAMRGVGSHSCGPDLPDEFEIPRQGSNTFKLKF